MSRTSWLPTRSLRTAADPVGSSRSAAEHRPRIAAEHLPRRTADRGVPRTPAAESRGEPWCAAEHLPRNAAEHLPRRVADLGVVDSTRGDKEKFDKAKRLGLLQLEPLAINVWLEVPVDVIGMAELSDVEVQHVTLANLPMQA